MKCSRFLGYGSKFRYSNQKLLRSANDFITQEINELKSDSSHVKSIQSFLTDIDGNPVYQLTYEDSWSFMDHKTMVIFVKKENKVYEISYSARRDQFSKYLSIVEKMVETFRFGTNNDVLANDTQISSNMPKQIGPNSQEQTVPKTIDPLQILKRRFAMGEIDESSIKG